MFTVRTDKRVRNVFGGRGGWRWWMMGALNSPSLRRLSGLMGWRERKQSKVSCFQESHKWRQLKNFYLSSYDGVRWIQTEETLLCCTSLRNVSDRLSYSQQNNFPAVVWLTMDGFQQGIELTPHTEIFSQFSQSRADAAVTGCSHTDCVYMDLSISVMSLIPILSSYLGCSVYMHTEKPGYSCCCIMINTNIPVSVYCILFAQAPVTFIVYKANHGNFEIWEK